MIKSYSEYKDSGIEWLKEIPVDWPLAKFKRFGKIRNGKDQKAVLVDDGEYPVLGTGGVFGRANEYLYDKPSVLLGRKGTIDKPQYIEEPFWTVDTLFYTEVYEENSPKFLYYFSKIFPFSFLQESSAVPSMTQGKLHNLELCKPPYKEQTKIAEYLDHQTGLLDAIVQKKQQLIEKIKEQRQAIINEAVTQGLNPDAPMKDSGVEWLGEIPENWTMIKLKYLKKKIGSGVTPRGGGEVYVDEGVLFLRSQNVHFEGLSLKDVKKIDEETHYRMNNSKVNQNDVLLNITGASIGRCCVVELDEEMNVNQHVCIIRPNDKITPKYLNLILQSPIGQTQVKLLATGGNREGLTFEAIKNFDIPLPTIDEQQKITSKILQRVEGLEMILKQAKKQLELLNQYRQSIISEAVTGKIDVREWEPKTAEAV